MYTGIHVKYPLLLSYIHVICTSSIDFREILKYQISWESVRESWVVPCGRTDMKLIVAFRNFANAPKKLCAEGPKSNILRHLS